jgi:5,10-methylenetetrahydromethanopterin reductase
VTNPVTRDAAVTASAIMTVQVESDGRAELGIGRGDSSLGHLGRDPAPVSQLDRYLRQVQGYLRGEAVDLNGFASRLQWLEAAGKPKVPVHVAATGPRVIALAARHAERIMFAVGADLDRLRWALALARTRRQEQGQDPASVALGAYVNVVVHPDAAAARESARGAIGAFAHFSGMRGASTELLRPDDRVIAERIASGYDMVHHLRNAAAQVTSPMLSSSGLRSSVHRSSALRDCGP